MGARERIEARIMAKVKTKRKLRSHLNTIKECVDKAEEEKLPTAVALKSMHIILKELVSDY